jgi:hypothetical protein
MSFKKYFHALQRALFSAASSMMKLLAMKLLAMKLLAT